MTKTKFFNKIGLGGVVSLVSFGKKKKDGIATHASGNGWSLEEYFASRQQMAYNPVHYAAAQFAFPGHGSDAMKAALAYYAARTARMHLPAGIINKS